MFPLLMQYGPFCARYFKSTTMMFAALETILQRQKMLPGLYSGNPYKREKQGVVVPDEGYLHLKFVGIYNIMYYLWMKCKPE